MSPMPSGNSPAEPLPARAGGGRSILLLCYDNPFNNTAHSICLLTMVRRLLDHGGLDGSALHLLALNCVGTDVEKHAVRREQFVRTYAGRISCTLVTRALPKRRLYATVYEFMRSRRTAAAFIARHAVDTVYAYGEAALFILGPALRRLPELRVLFDCRGDFLSEERARHVWWPPLAAYRALYRRHLPRVEKSFISSSRIVELLGRYGYAGPCVINTNYYDETMFTFRPRTFNREGTVFVYAGGSQPYQQLELMLRVFREYARLHPAARLMLVLSMIDDRIPDVINRSRVDRSLLSVHTAHDAAQVNAYLNGADIAFMLRDGHPLNHYAFPTKFAEYLGAGLPVISTVHVHDTAAIIRQQDTGILIDIDAPPRAIADALSAYVAGIGDDMPERCARYAAAALSWKNNVARITGEIAGRR